MKNVLLIILLFTLVSKSPVKAQTTNSPETKSAPKTGGKATFDNIVCDFGIIGYNSAGSHVYVITNTGDAPLVIYNCIKGCGCTNVEWTKTPINPGQKGYIKAVYNTKIIGHFSKGVDVYTSDPDNAKINLRLKGEVMVLPDGEKPPLVEKSPQNQSSKADVKW
jgi:hypothetical protein